MIQLPKWLRLPALEKNKLSLRLRNGSKITAKSSNADAARSEAVSLLLIDEAAFIDNIDETFTAAQQTLATGGQCLALSTPNGIGNWFHQTWEKAEAKENSFLPIRLPWTVHPERNSEMDAFVKFFIREVKKNKKMIKRKKKGPMFTKKINCTNYSEGLYKKCNFYWHQKTSQHNKKLCSYAQLKNIDTEVNGV